MLLCVAPLGRNRPLARAKTHNEVELDCTKFQDFYKPAICQPERVLLGFADFDLVFRENYICADLAQRV